MRLSKTPLAFVFAGFLFSTAAWGAVEGAGQRSLHTLPRPFVANEGQWPSSVRFAAPGFYGTSWLTAEGRLRHLVLDRGACAEGGNDERGCKPRSWVLEERFIGGKIESAVGAQPTKTRYRFFLGRDASRHVRGARAFERVELGEVYPGIRVSLQAAQASVEKVFVVEPGADPRQIAVAIEGARGLRLDEEGRLLALTDHGEIAFSAPIAWQEEGGGRQPVEVAYELSEDGKQYRFALGGYDPARTLWIDPLLQSTYLGGSGFDWGAKVAIHPISGDVYVTGATTSSNFPVTVGAFDGTYGGVEDAYVARIDASLGTFLAVTYLGGNALDRGMDIAIDPGSPAGEVVVVGYTGSTDFPVAGSPY